MIAISMLWIFEDVQLAELEVPSNTNLYHLIRLSMIWSKIPYYQNLSHPNQHIHFKLISHYPSQILVIHDSIIIPLPPPMSKPSQPVLPDIQHFGKFQTIRQILTETKNRKLKANGFFKIPIWLDFVNV